MQKKGRKNASGSWLLGEIFERVAGISVIAMVIVGFAWGLVLGGTSLIGNMIQLYPRWSVFCALGITALAYGNIALVLHRTQTTWVRGLTAEKSVGDHIEHALVRPGCAFAHDVKEALGGSGNVDHVVLTPARIWVIETKSGWMGEEPFQNALRQTAINVERVRKHLGKRVPVRGAIVLADKLDLYESERDWKGEPVTVFRVVSFWRRLQQDCYLDDKLTKDEQLEKLARKVWDLGSTRHLKF